LGTKIQAAQRSDSLLQHRKAAEHRRTPQRKREISAESPPGFGVRQCPAAFEGAL